MLVTKGPSDPPAGLVRRLSAAGGGGRTPPAPPPPPGGARGWLSGRAGPARLAVLVRRLSAAGGGQLPPLLALSLLMHAADRVAAGITGTDLTGPMNDLGQVPDNARTEGIASGFAGL